ncbi:MAG TPA: hypothetical protein PK263_04845 [bacterium]|nr:hypothetical protein [bacterium]
MNQNTAYSDEAVHDLKSWLQNAAAQGHQKFYEVMVDGRKIIFLTDNLELLDDLNTWISTKTKLIKVLVYNTKTSHRYQTFEFNTEHSLEEQQKEKQEREERDLKRQQSLSGFSSADEINRKMNETVEQALAKERHELEFKRLKEENTKLQSQTEKDNSYIAKLEEKLEGFESQRFKLTTDNIINVGSGILGNLVESNPMVLDSVAGLAGLITPVKKKDTGMNGVQGEMSFKMKSKTADTGEEESEEENEEEESEQEFDEATQAKLDLFEEAEQNLNDDQYERYFRIVQFLAQRPDLVETVYALLKDESRVRKKVA